LSIDKPPLRRLFVAVNEGNAVFALVASEVFNMFVENSVDKPGGISVSDSLSDASTLCTEASAGTSVVENALQFFTQHSQFGIEKLRSQIEIGEIEIVRS
jgi:hypothetical protein